MSRPDSATSSSSSSTSSNQTSSAQLRKIKKPMIERRRRERINVCLNQLKSLVLEALKKNESSYSKMEKADILEMTVAHLKSLQHRHPENDQKVRDHDPAARCHDGARYVLGFRECANEVEKYLTTLNTVDRPGVEVLSALIQYLRDRTEDVQKAVVRSSSDQLHPVMESASFSRAESLMQQQLQAAHQPSKIVEYECNESQPSTGATRFRMSDSSAPDSAAAATRYILGQLPYLQHPYAGLTSSLTISDQTHFATSATSLTLARREQAQSPTQGDEFPRALGVRIPRGSGIFQRLRESQISPDSGISLDSPPTQVYRSKSVKSESVVEFLSQSDHKVKPRSQLETVESGPSSDCLWRPW